LRTRYYYYYDHPAVTLIRFFIYHIDRFAGDFHLCCFRSWNDTAWES